LFFCCDKFDFAWKFPNNSRKVSFSEKLPNPPKNKPRHQNLIFHSEIFYGEFEALYLLNISNLLSVTCFRQRMVNHSKFCVKLDVIFVANKIKKYNFFLKSLEWSHRNFLNFVAFLSQVRGCLGLMAVKFEWAFPLLFWEKINGLRKDEISVTWRTWIGRPLF
jgi:hypothetical protein